MAVFHYCGQFYRISDLPKSYNEVSWSMRFKLMVATAVLTGSLSKEVAQQRYRMLASELEFWCRAVTEQDMTLVRTSRAYSESKGRGWEFPECERIVAGGFVYAGHQFRAVSTPRYPSGLVLHYNDREIQFTRLESDVLRVLVHYQGTVIPSEMLMVYRKLRRGSPRFLNQKIVDVAVGNIRSKLQHTSLLQYMATVWGRGYMLLSPPEDTP